MKIFKNTKAKKDAKIAAAIKDFLTKFKLKEKIDLANQWSDAHKKKVTIITIGTLTLSLIIGSWLTLTADYNEADLFSEMAEVPFDGMRRIQRLKNIQVDQTMELTNRGQKLKHELDSLVHLPIKSHKDSVDIMVQYKQLEIVVKALDNKQ